MEDGYLKDGKHWENKSNWGNANINQWKLKDY